MICLISFNSALLQRKPMATQCVTAGILFGTGDVIAQQIIEKQGKKHDVRPSQISQTSVNKSDFKPLLVRTYCPYFILWGCTVWTSHYEMVPNSEQAPVQNPHACRSIPCFS